MFIYNEADETYEDKEREIRVVARGGFGPGITSWDASGPGWTFRFGIRRESDQYSFEGEETISNPDCSIKLSVWTLEAKGGSLEAEFQAELAKDIALLRETRLYESDLTRITVN